MVFFEALASRFGPDHERLTAAVEAWRQDPTVWLPSSCQPLLSHDAKNCFGAGTPEAIGPILAKEHTILSPEKANTAAFYSISN